MASVLFGEHLEIPLGIKDLADFRRWAHSQEFPQRGGIAGAEADEPQVDWPSSMAILKATS